MLSFSTRPASSQKIQFIQTSVNQHCGGRERYLDPSLCACVKLKQSLRHLAYLQRSRLLRPHRSQNASFSRESRQTRGNLGGTYTLCNQPKQKKKKLPPSSTPADDLLVLLCGEAASLGGFSAQRCETGSRQKNRFVVINSSRPSLESVSFLSADRALS